MILLIIVMLVMMTMTMVKIKNEYCNDARNRFDACGLLFFLASLG
jgi:hypothetical protein